MTIHDTKVRLVPKAMFEVASITFNSVFDEDLEDRVGLGQTSSGV